MTEGPALVEIVSKGYPTGELDVAILLAMTLSEQVPLADFKNHLSEVVDRVERQHGRVVITKHGRPAAVLISVSDLESLEETIEVMRDPALVEALRESAAEITAGRTEPLTKDQALSLIKRP
jgi:prevent-host-death family protein